MAGIFVNPNNVSNASYTQQIATDTVQARFDISHEYASNALGYAYSYAEDMNALVKGLEVPDTTIDTIYLPPIDRIRFDERPDLGDLNIEADWPTESPEKGELNDVDNLMAIDIPLFTFNTPEIKNLDPPNLPAIPDPGEVPSIDVIAKPAKPDLSLPPVPVLKDIYMPAAPILDLPMFDSTLDIDPSDLEVPPGFSWSESAYNSPVWNTLLDKVLDGMINGGTGLGEQVEQDIWDRAQRRIDIEGDKKVQELENYYAAMGHESPPGALIARNMDLSREIIRSKTDLSRDIAVKQAELARDYTQYITDKGLSLETLLRDFHNAQMGRAIEAASQLVTAGVAIFKAKIDQQNLQILKYKADAEVYESRVKAALTTIEIFKAEVEASKVSAEVQELLVEIYSKQVEAVEVAAKIYATEVETANLELEHERLKLETFKLSTDAYIARLNGQKNLVEIYGIEVDAERTKAAIFTEQTKGYVAQVDAKRTIAQVDIEKVRSQLERRKQTIEIYQSELEAYKTDIQATATKVGAQVEGFKGAVAAYSAETAAIGMQYSTIIKEIDARISEAQVQGNIAIAEVEAATTSYVAVKDLQIKGTDTVTTVSAQLAASALGAANANASMSSSASNSNSDSFSSSESLSESHGFQHEG